MKAKGIGQLFNIKNILFWGIVLVLLWILCYLWMNNSDTKEDFATFDSTEYQTTTTRNIDYTLGNEFNDFYTSVSNLCSYNTKNKPLDNFVNDIDIEINIKNTTDTIDVSETKFTPKRIVEIITSTRNTFAGFVSAYEENFMSELQPVINNMANNYLDISANADKYKQCVQGVSNDVKQKNDSYNKIFIDSDKDAVKNEQVCYEDAKTKYMTAIAANSDDPDGSILKQYMNDINDPTNGCVAKYNKKVHT